MNKAESLLVMVAANLKIEEKGFGFELSEEQKIAILEWYEVWSQERAATV